MAVFPLLRTASTEKCEEFGKGSVHLFFFYKRRVPWNEHSVRAFSKKGHNLYFSHFPQAVFKSPQSIWLAYTDKFIQCLHGTLCGFLDGYENLCRQGKKFGMQCFHSWLKESLHWARGKVLSWSDLIQTILCSCSNKFSSFQVIYFNYSVVSVIDFFFYIL